MAVSAGGAKAPIASPAIACLLIADCVWRLVTPGGPWPVSPWHYISMRVALLLLIGLVALGRTYPGPAPDAPTYVRWGGWLFGLGVAAGIHYAAAALHQRPCLVDRAPQRRRLLASFPSPPDALQTPSLLPIFRVLRRTINPLSPIPYGSPSYSRNPIQGDIARASLGSDVCRR